MMRLTTNNVVLLFVDVIDRISLHAVHIRARDESKERRNERIRKEKELFSRFLPKPNWRNRLRNVFLKQTVA